MPALSALLAALRRPPRHRFVAASLLIMICVAGASLVAQGQAQQSAPASQTLPAGVHPPEVRLVSEADLRSYVGWILLGFAGTGLAIAFAAGAFRGRIETDVRTTRDNVSAFRQEWQADREQQAERLDDHSEQLAEHRRDLDLLRLEVDRMQESG